MRRLLSVSLLTFLLKLSKTESFSFRPPPAVSRATAIGTPLFFSATSKNDLSTENSPVEDEEPHDHDDEELSIHDFVEMLEQCPNGQLEGEEITLIKEALACFAQDDDNENDLEAAQLTERLLRRWVQEWQSSRRVEQEPSAQDFETALRLWAVAMGDPSNRNTNDLPTAVKHIWTLYIYLQDLYQKTKLDSLQPNANVFCIVLQSLAASRERGTDRKAWSVLETIREYGQTPNPEHYHYVIQALAKSRDRGAANRAEILLRQAAKEFPPPNGISIDSFNVVLTSWAKSGLEYGPERAEKLIVFMDEINLRPSVSSFTSLIDAYTQTNEWEGIAHAESILNRMVDQHLEGEENLEPNVASWTIVISAWARLSKKNARGAAARADRLLRRMESLWNDGRISFAPDAITYITCMNAWAYHKGTDDGAAKAQEILDETYERYLDGDDSMRPTARSIKVVIDTWTRSNDPDAMDKAEAVLDKYEDHLDSIAQADDKPEVIDDIREIYRSLLYGWCKAEDPAHAQAYLNDMVEKDFKPDCFCFDRIIEANTYVDDDESLERTQQVMALAKELEEKGDLNPNERLYTSYIRALTKSRVNGLAQKAEEVVQEMQRKFEQGNLGIAPCVFTYNALLMACSEELSTETPDRMGAMKIAIKTFQTVRTSKEGPDHVTFGNMLRCSNLLPQGEQKDQLIQSTFQLCCKRGFVNNFVVRDLQFAAPEPLWRSLLRCPAPETQVDVERLPSDWRRMFASRKRS